MGSNSLDKIEEEIFNLTREFLKKMPLSSITEIISYINKRTNYKHDINRNKIEQVIKKLVKMKMILPGTKLVKQQLLKNPMRKKIFETISKNPGINLNDLMKIQDIGANQVLWHLKFLKKFECIRTKRYGNQKAYYLHETDQTNDDYHFYIRNDKVQKILDILKKNHEKFNTTKLRITLGMNYNTVKKYLDILCKLNVVKVEKQDNTDCFYYNKDIVISS